MLKDSRYRGYNNWSNYVQTISSSFFQSQAIIISLKLSAKYLHPNQQRKLLTTCYSCHFTEDSEVVCDRNDKSLSYHWKIFCLQQFSDWRRFLQNIIDKLLRRRKTNQLKLLRNDSIGRIIAKKRSKNNLRIFLVAYE